MSGRVTTAFVSLKSRCVKQWCGEAFRRRQNVCDIYCNSEKKMERKMLVPGEAIGQPHSGIRIEASLGKYVFGVFETTSATCGELRQTASPTPLAVDRCQTECLRHILHQCKKDG